MKSGPCPLEGHGTQCRGPDVGSGFDDLKVLKFKAGWARGQGFTLISQAVNLLQDLGALPSWLFIYSFQKHFGFRWVMEF